MVFSSIPVAGKIADWVADAKATFGTESIVAKVWHSNENVGVYFQSGMPDSTVHSCLGSKNLSIIEDVWQGSYQDFVTLSGWNVTGEYNRILAAPLHFANMELKGVVYLLVKETNLTEVKEVLCLKWMARGLSHVLTDALENATIGRLTFKSGPHSPSIWYKSFFDSNTYAIFLLNKEGAVVEVNQSAAELLETTVAHLMSTQKISLFENSGLNAINKSKFYNALNGNSESFDIDIITYKGNKKIVHVAYMPAHLDGTVYGVNCIVKDITHRKQAEHVLKESEYQLKLVLEGANVGWWDWDMEQDQPYFDPKWWAMLGYEPEEVKMCLGFRDYFNTHFLHKDDAQPSETLFRKAVAQGVSNYEIEYRLRHKNGHYVPILSRGFITYNDAGKPVRISGINLDLTRARQAEETLIRSENNLKTVFENTEVGYILVSQDMKIVSFNKPAKALTLKDYGKELEVGASIFSYADAETHRQNEALYKSVLSGRKEKLNKKITTSGQDERWYDITYSPVTGKGHHHGFMISIEDISERVKNELELKRSLHLLTEQNKRLLNFSYIVSHNLRSHTINFRSLLSFLREAETADEQNEMVTMLESVSENLNETINNLNEVVSIHNNVNLVLEYLSLWEYIKRAEEVLSGQIMAKNVLVSNTVPREAIIKYNPAYLESILLNFLSNAIKYAHPDRRPQVIFASEYVEGKLMLQISDNGLGIDLQKNGDKLFGLYKTFHNNIDAKGVGLFLTKNQIDFMGGRIEVESEPGKGTIFKIYF